MLQMMVILNFHLKEKSINQERDNVNRRILQHPHKGVASKTQTKYIVDGATLIMSPNQNSS